MEFVIEAKEGKARTGRISTKHGTLETPNFIPVATQATVKSLSSEKLHQMEIQAILCNTYHLYLQPGHKLVEKSGQLHNFMNWHKPIFTDSGGYQVFSLSHISKIDDEKIVFQSHIDNSKHTFTPEKSIEIQESLGADIIFAFDQCIDFNSDYPTAKKSVERTHAWALRCLAAHKTDQALYGIVQGGQFEDLRRESAKFISSLPFPGYGLGSLFGNPKEKSLQVMKWMMEELPEEKPKHFLGLGAIEDIFEGVALGADTFDCVLPTRLARQGYIFTSEGNIKNKWRYRVTTKKNSEDFTPLDKNCSCSVCKMYTKAYLHHLFKSKELSAYSLVTEHNLFFFNTLMKKIREAIRAGKFTAMKERWLKEN